MEGGAGTVGRLNVFLGMVSDAFHKGLDQAQSKLTSFSNFAKNAGRTLTTFVTAPLLAGAGMAVKWASDTQESLNAVSRTYGTASDGVIAWSNTTAKAHGIAQADSLATMAVLSSVGRAAGMTDSEMASFGQGLVARSADLASFYNAAGGTNEVLGAMQAGLRGEFDPLERFGIRMNAGMVEAKALEMGLIGANGVMTDQAKILATNALIMEQSEAVAGDFAMTSDGLANKQRILGARIKDLGASFGMHLLPIVEKGVAIFERLLGWFEKLSPAGQKIALIVAGVAAALGPMLLIMGHFAGALANIIKIAPAVSKAMMLIGRGATLMLGPWGLVILALIALGVAYKTNLFGFRDAVNKVAKAVISFLKPIVSGIMDFIDTVKLMKTAFDVGGITAALGVLAVWFNKVFGAGATQVVFGFIQKVIDFARQLKEAFGVNGISGVLAILATKLDSVFGSAATGVFIRGIQSMIDLVMQFVAIVQTTIALVGAMMSGDWARAWDLFKQLAEQAINFIVDAVLLMPRHFLDAFQAINWGAVGSLLLAGFLAALDFLADIGTRAWNFIKGKFDEINWGELISDVGDVLVNAGASLIGGLVEGVRWIYDEKVKPFFEGLPEAAAGLIDDTFGFLKSKGKSLLGLVVSGITEYWDVTLKPWLLGLPKKAAEAIEDAGNFLKDKGKALLSLVWDGIKEFFDADFTTNLAALPGWAAGRIKDSGSALLNKGKELIGYVWNGMYEWFADDFTTNLAALPGWAASRIKDSGNALLSKGKELLSWVWNGIQQFADSDFAAHLAGIPGWMATQIVDAGNSLLGKGKELAQSLWQGVTDWLADIDWASIPGNIVDSLKEAVLNAITGGGALEDDSPGGGSWIPGRFAGDMGQTGGKITDSLSKLIGDARGFDFAGKFKAVFGGAQITETLVKPFQDARPQVAAIVTGLSADVVSRLTALRSAATAQVTSMAQTTTTIMSAWRGAVTAQVTQAATSMIATLTGLRGQMGALAAAAGESFRAGIAAGMAAAVSAAANGAAAVRSAASVGSLFNQGFSVGQSLGQGIASGIQSYVNAVASAAASIVNTAVNAARTAAQAASPSKRMMALGDDLVEGLLIPLVAGQRSAASAMAALVATPSVPGLAMMGGGGGTFGATTHGPTTVTIHVNGAGDPKKVAEEVWYQFDNAVRRREGV